MKKYKIFIICSLLFAVSCTDMEVVPYRELTPENFYQNRTQIIAGVNRIYTHNWCSIAGGAYGGISEASADQISWTNKGRHGYDNGSHGREHYHSWTAEESGVARSPWVGLYTGIGYANSILGDFQNIDFAAAGMSDEERLILESEIKGIRAFWYMKLMDLYGGVPISTQVGTPVNPPRTPRAEVFDFVETELLEAAKTAAPLTKERNGRFTLSAIYMSLVELYLNAEVWSGTARWDDCINYCNKLLNGEAGSLNGPMELDDDVNTAFSNTNKDRSKEIIWSNAYSKANGRALSWNALAYFRERDIVNSDYGANNGYHVSPTFFENYSENDLRKIEWFLYGIGNHKNQGPYLNIATSEPNDFVIGTEEFIGLPIIFCNKPIKAVIDVQGGNIVITEWYSPEFPGEDAKLLIQDAFNGSNVKDILIDKFNDGEKEIYLAGGYNTTDPRQYAWSTMNDYRYMWYDCKENSGAHFQKYKSGEITDPNYQNFDLIYYRLTDVYFAKAEALMRKAGNTATQEAVDLINEVKKRAFLPAYWSSADAVTNNDRYTTSSLTMNELLTERGREFIFESKRRMDLIRFDVFEFGIPWWDANAGYPDGSNGTIIKDKTRRLLPIYSAILLSNPNLEQNPGY